MSQHKSGPIGRKQAPVDRLPSAPSGWRWTKLSQVVRFRNGADYGAVEAGRPGYPVYGSGGRFRWASSWLFDGPSVLFGRKGTIDKPLFVTGKFWTVDTMYYTEVDKRNLDPKFLYYWATRFPFDFYATDTALPSMTQTDLGSEPIALPSLPEQRAIADFLDHETAEIDALIVEQTRLADLQRERWQSALIKAIQQGLSEPDQLVETGHSTWPYAPVGWLPTRLKSTVSSIGNGMWGSEPDVEESTRRCIRVADFSKEAGRIHDRNVTHRSYSRDLVERQALCPGDLVIEKSGGGPTTPVGNVVLYEGEGGDMYSNFVARIVLRPEIDPLYAVYLHRSLYLGRVTDRSIKQTTGIQNLDASAYLNEPIYLPPMTEQRAIGATVDESRMSMESSLGLIDRANMLAQERRAALISAAVTGQIDVTDRRRGPSEAERLDDELAQSR